MKDNNPAPMQTRHATTIRPSAGKALRSVARRFTPMVAAVVLLQFWLAGPSTTRDRVFDYILIAIVLAVVAADWVYRMTTVLELTDDELIVRILIRRRAIPRRQIQGIALRSVYTYPSSRSYAVVYGDHGAKIVTLPQGIWEDADIHRLQAALGSRDRSYRQVTSEEFRKEFGSDFFSPYIGWIVAIVIVLFIFIAAAGR